MRMQKSPSTMRSVVSSASPSLPTKMLLLLIALFPLSASFLQGASAFVPPSWQAAQTVTLSPNRVVGTGVSVSPSIGSRTKLWAEMVDDDNMDDSSVSKQTPKSTSKGAQQKKTPKQNTEAAAKSKTTNTTRKTKGGATQKKKQPVGNKKPIEISAQSLSPSQMESNAVVDSESEEQRQKDEFDQKYAYNIPKTGYSLADQLENKSPENQERFETTLTPIVVGIRESEKEEVKFEYDDDGFPIGVVQEEVEEENNEEEEGNNSLRRHQGVARIDTISTLGNVGEEPVRWLVSLGDTDDDDGDDHRESYAMVDLPPYSDKLADEIRSFMDPEYNNATDAAASDSSSDNVNKSKAKASAGLEVILLTNQQCIHYDSSPAVYVTRKSDLQKWKKAFPSAEVIMYRLDVPRECREEVTQILDGYGPWGWDEEQGGENKEEGKKFMETGRPLTIEEWDDDTKSKVLTQGEMPPDDQEVENDDASTNSSSDDDDGDDSLYSPEAIRQREEKYRLLAVYTPGHTFGSVTYIFPQRGICCSGYTLPLESSGNTASEDDYYDDYDEADVTSSKAVPPQGPRLDYQGYMATSASRPRQMSSALSLINNYIDRFRVVLPARGDVVFLDSEKETRKREIMESVGLYQKIGDIYGRLGIVE
eukprot:CAMPEP_0172298650 /NCGR_PEP_ID=MMETSP1058-20130122/1206_1 /TAXON_ID=83371 /ORGANISM="Detonula confervacea, Strain CCMP 353" /LENGTH=647 /DNA_ID=CAMNT_0013007931 /DNA_START=119 /DNA_END=2062 /DNA_ORIENTATION=-